MPGFFLGALCDTLRLRNNPHFGDITMQVAKTIDMTPTWESLLPWMMTYVNQAEHFSIFSEMGEELQRMAKAADQWNAYCKSIQDYDQRGAEQLQLPLID
mgnify:FL=1